MMDPSIAGLGVSTLPQICEFLRRRFADNGSVSANASPGCSSRRITRIIQELIDFCRWCAKVRHISDGQLRRARDREGSRPAACAPGRVCSPSVPQLIAGRAGRSCLDPGRDTQGRTGHCPIRDLRWPGRYRWALAAPTVWTLWETIAAKDAVRWCPDLFSAGGLGTVIGQPSP